MRHWGQEGDDEQVIRGTLGRLLLAANGESCKSEAPLRYEEGRGVLRQTVTVENPMSGLADEPGPITWTWTASNP